MTQIRQNFSISFTYDVFFTKNIFSGQNPLLANVINRLSGSPEKKILFVLDEGLLPHFPDLEQSITKWAGAYTNQFHVIKKPIIVTGGEEVKNDYSYTQKVLDAVNRHGIDRHSFIVAVGGGSVIDMAGYAAAIAHRGIRLIRVPTTVLAQNDAAIGVKNGINAYGKKNFLGTFVPPVAVINDSEFLKTLGDRDWRAGIAESIKVALLKDPDFFCFLEENVEKLSARHMPSMEKMIYRCAELHLEHISTSGDPFELGSSRPLDFGHWAAHKLEQLTQFDLRHGEAVAIGLALDVTYSFLKGDITEIDHRRIIRLLHKSGFTLYVPELKSNLDNPSHPNSLLHGLEEFREHLGGRLTIMLLRSIGKGIEVNSVDTDIYKRAITMLENLENTYT